MRPSQALQFQLGKGKPRLVSAFDPLRTLAGSISSAAMFWTWANLKRVYIALAVVAAAAASAWFIALQVRAPDWVFSTVWVAAFTAWIGVVLVAAVRQASDNRRE